MDRSRFRRLFTTQQTSLRVLDLLSAAPAAVYSLRLMRSLYKGPAIRVRRSLDNAEMDIGFTPDGNLNTVALMEFVGSQNLISLSEEFDNATWLKVGGAVTANVLSSPDGSVNTEFFKEDTSTLAHATYRNITVTTSTVHTFSVYLAKFGSANSRRWAYISLATEVGNSTRYTILIDLQAGSVIETRQLGSPVGGGSSITDEGNFWRVGVTLRSESTAIIAIIGAVNSATPVWTTANDVNYTGDNTSGIYVWGAQLNTGALQPYSPTSRRNLLTYSQSFANAAWRKVGSGTGSAPVVTPNAGTAPDGTQTAQQVVFNLNGGTAIGDQSLLDQQAATTITGKPYVYSVSMRTTDGSTKIIQLSANGAANVNCTVTGEWQRFSLFVASSLDTVRNIVIRLRGSFGNSDSADLLIWGTQQEQSTILTPYQRVDAAWSATRDGNGFVSTWYDQSGNARNAVQATAESQPRIVVSGAINFLNGKPTVSTVDTNTQLSAESVPLNTPYTVNAVANKTSGLSYQRLVASSVDVRFFMGTLNGDFISPTGNGGMWNNIGAVNTPVTVIGATPRVLSVTVLSNGASPFIDGQTQDTRVGSSASNTGVVIFKLSSQSWAGSSSEIVIFPSALSTTDRQALERNQGSYYGITVS